MKLRRWVGLSVLGVGAAALLWTAPAIAHHSSAPFYDSTKKIEAQGTVTKFLFKNPHSFLYFEAEENGKNVEWQVELGRGCGAGADRCAGRRRLRSEAGNGDRGGRPARRARRARTGCAARVSRVPTAARSSPGGRVVKPRRRADAAGVVPTGHHPQVSWPIVLDLAGGDRCWPPGRASPASISGRTRPIRDAAHGGLSGSSSARAPCWIWRLLGFAPAAVGRCRCRALFRLIAWAFALNATTGILLFMADATNKARQPILYIKLALIALALWDTLLAKRLIRAGTGAGDVGSARRGRLVAASSLVLWAAAITAGRLMAYV